MVFPRTSPSLRRLLFGRRIQIRLFIVLLALLSAATGSFFLRGRVVSVADGDTVTVYAGVGGGDRVRLYGIDCPEYDQPGGREAAAFASSLALFEPVEVTVMDKDQYGRLVAVVSLPGGRVLNEELLKEGHAWVYDSFCRAPRCGYWRELQKEARQARRGLWQDENRTPPWLWRKTHR